MRLIRLFWALAAVLLAAATVVAGPDAAEWSRLQAIYDYDASAPLDAEVHKVEDAALFSVEQLSFAGMDGERVPATLVRPFGVERPPCVLFLHGLGGDRTQARMASVLLISQGVAVLGIDAALHGERAVPGISFAEMGPELAAVDGPLVRTVVDNRRAIDYIESREDLDSSRIVLVGASMGGILGSIVTAVDERVGAALLLVAGGSWSAILLESEHPVAQRLRAAGLAEGESLAHVEPVNFIRQVSPRPLLMINGTEDTIIPSSSAQALFDAAGEPKELRWFSGGHVDLPPTEVLFVTTWVGATARELPGAIEVIEAAP